MRAVTLHAAEDVRVEEVPVPSPRGDEVLLEITAAGICGTDAAFYTYGAKAQGDGYNVQCPVVLGHEFAGVVVAIGPDVKNLRVGDEVASGAAVSCGRCWGCRQGRTNLCTNNRTAGIHFDGGLAEYCAISERACEPTAPHGVRGDDAALSQPMSIAHHGVRGGRIGAGDRALIVGVGGIGIFATWIAAQLGAAVTAVDVDPERLAMAKQLGAAETVTLDGRGLAEALAGHERWDAIYEVTGRPEPLREAVELAGKGTRVVIVGVQKQPLTLDAARLVAQEIELTGSAAQMQAVDLPAALEMVAARAGGWADVAPTVFSLEETIEGALLPLVERRPVAVKALVDPRATETRPYAHTGGSR